MWPFDLSVRLLIVDLVSRYLTNYLIRREPIFVRIAPLTWKRCLPHASCGISTSFPVLSPSQRQVAHALLTRPPLTFFRSKLQNQFVRLECVKHAASVHPEPGSNSRIKYFTVLGTAIYLFELDSLFYFFPWVSQFVIKLCVLLWNLTSSLVRLSTFLALFSRLSLFNFQGTGLLPLFATACIVYHTQFRLSRGFQNFFQVSFRHFRSLQVAFSASFLRSPCLSLPFGHRLPCGALLYYHFLLLLSTPFFTFFQLFRAFFSTFRAFYPFFRGFGGLDRVFNGFWGCLEDGDF